MVRTILVFLIIVSLNACAASDDFRRTGAVKAGDLAQQAAQSRTIVERRTAHGLSLAIPSQWGAIVYELALPTRVNGACISHGYKRIHVVAGVKAGQQGERYETVFAFDSPSDQCSLNGNVLELDAQLVPFAEVLLRNTRSVLACVNDVRCLEHKFEPFNRIGEPAKYIRVAQEEAGAYRIEFFDSSISKMVVVSYSDVEADAPTSVSFEISGE